MKTYIDISDREQKIKRLLQNATKAHLKGDYLKIYTDMILFSLKEGITSIVACYVAAQFLYAGQARTTDRPALHIAELIGKKERTVYRYFDWLLARNWFGKDEKNGWYFFRGFERIHEIENWKYRRAAVTYQKDLLEFKAFCIGAVMASMVKTGRGTGTDRPNRRSMPSCYPISLTSIQKVLNVSRRTAITYRKLAKKHGFIKMRPDLPQVTGITVNDLRYLRQSDEDSVTIKLFGSDESITVHPKQLRMSKGFIYAQLTNIITPCIALKKRN